MRPAKPMSAHFSRTHTNLGRNTYAAYRARAFHPKHKRVTRTPQPQLRVDTSVGRGNKLDGCAVMFVPESVRAVEAGKKKKEEVKVKAFAKEERKVVEKREEGKWVCDFCGLECFCEGFPE
jgi:hypothetical protein